MRDYIAINRDFILGQKFYRKPYTRWVFFRFLLFVDESTSELTITLPDIEREMGVSKQFAKKVIKELKYKYKVIDYTLVNNRFYTIHIKDLGKYILLNEKVDKTI